MKPTEHQAVLRVLRMVDEFLAAQPADTLTASTPTGGLMTWGELRRHVGGAVGIMEANTPRPGRNPWPGGRRARR